MQKLYEKLLQILHLPKGSQVIFLLQGSLWKSPRFLPQLLGFCEGQSKLEFVWVFRITGAQQEASFFPFSLVGGWETVNLHTNLDSRLAVVCQHHPESLRFHPERKTPWDFCKILLSCSNGSSSGSGELLCYQCPANCSSISLLPCLPPLTRLSNKLV